MNRKDLVAAAILLLIAGAYQLATRRIPSSTLDDGVGARGFPAVLTVALVVLAVAIAVRALAAVPAAARSDGDRDGDGTETEARWPRALGLLALGGLYIAGSIVLGYPLALFLLLLAVPLYEGMRFSWRIVAVAAAGAVFFYTLFEIVLGVRQPGGLFL